MVLQYKDRNVSKFEYHDPNLLRVKKIFATIQGEGPYAGHPAVFVRLGGCNRGQKEGMNCEFCDTDFRFDKSVWMSLDAVLDAVKGLYVKQISDDLTVITGGEPMLQMAQITKLSKRLIASGSVVQIETNGDITPSADLAMYTIIVTSPKASGKEKKFIDITDEQIDRIRWAKFLVEADPASPYYNLPTTPNWMKYWNRNPGRIMLSPITVYGAEVKPQEIASAWRGDQIDFLTTRANYRRAAELALRYGVRVSMQQHLFFGVE